jgi:hypothetical protein
VLGLCELGPPAVTGKGYEILSHDRDRAPCALFPRRIRGGVHHDLPNDAPTRVVRIAAGNQKPRQSVGDALGFRFGGMYVQMPQRIADVTAIVDRPGELSGRPARLVLLIFDPSTVLTAKTQDRGYACRMPIPRFLKGRVAKEEAVLVGDPRVEGWESVGMFEDQATALAWRDQLRLMGVDACCVADHPLDRSGHGDIFLVVPPDQWSHATEIVDNLG